MASHPAVLPGPLEPDPDLESAADGLRLARIAAAFRNFMQSLGLDPHDPDLAGTDRRVARAYAELVSGLRPGGEPSFTTFANTENHQGIVSLTEIPFYSICAHHFLPFFGTAHVGYVPGDRLAGLSKLARVVDFYARRPQLQERMTEQIASFLDQRLAPAGVIVLLEGRHLCLEMRGVAKPGAVTTTLAARGVLQEGPLTRQFLARVHAGRASSPAREI